MGRPGRADIPAEEDEPMTKAVAFLGRQQLFQLLLHLVGILGVAQPQPVGDPDAVGVRHHHAGDVENIAAHEIGGFPSHPRQLDELLHRLGNLPVIHVRSIPAMATMSRALVLYSPQDRIYSPTSSGEASANASRVGYRSNSAGVTRFTRASVHWADSRVAMRSWRGSV